jgi:hypothetical protein
MRAPDAVDGRVSIRDDEDHAAHMDTAHDERFVGA